ncbi:hypothetical protein SRHO_G00216390 [Serrasalmus rhombeus]
MVAVYAEHFNLDIWLSIPGEHSSSSNCSERYYSTLLQSLMKCEEEIVGVVRSGLVARLGPDMDTLFQLLQKNLCPMDFGTGHVGTDSQESFRWPQGPPMFKIQPSMRNRDPNHLFAKKRSVEDRAPIQ